MREIAGRVRTGRVAGLELRWWRFLTGNLAHRLKCAERPAVREENDLLIHMPVRIVEIDAAQRQFEPAVQNVVRADRGRECSQLVADMKVAGNVAEHSLLHADGSRAAPFVRK